MPKIQETLRAKLKEAEELSTHIKQLNHESEEQREAIFRWAVVGDEATRLMIQAEEQLLPAHLARLKAEINGVEAGSPDLWSKYREGEWRLPKFGGPGPGDEPPPRMSLKDFLP